MKILRKLKIDKYIDYFKYLIVHKAYMMQMCFQNKLYLQGITHDLSKFLPDEFIPYANYYYAHKEIDIKRVWNKHKKRNKHHWQYWLLFSESEGIEALEIPEKYLMEMIFDWYAAAFCEGYENLDKRVLDWYTLYRRNILLNPKTRVRLERELNYVGYSTKD